MNMPGRDGTGPMGRGSRTGRGLGFCAGDNAVRYGAGLGFGCRRGFGRNFIADPFVANTEKELLAEQKDLKNRLDIISKQLEDLTDANK
jgi:hypothetical protein